MDLIKLFTKKLQEPNIVYPYVDNMWGDSYYLDIANIKKIDNIKKEAYSKIKDLLPLSRYSTYPILTAYNLISDNIYNNKPSKIFRLIAFSYAYSSNKFKQYIPSTKQFSIPTSMYYNISNVKIEAENKLLKSYNLINYVLYIIDSETGLTKQISPIKINYDLLTKKDTFGYYSNSKFILTPIKKSENNTVVIPSIFYSDKTNRYEFDSLYKYYEDTNSRIEKNKIISQSISEYIKSNLKYITISADDGLFILQFPSYLQSINLLTTSEELSKQGIGQFQPVYTYTKLSKQLNFGFKIVLLDEKNIDLHVYIYLQLHKLSLPLIKNSKPGGRIVQVHFPNSLIYTGYITSINFDISEDSTYFLYKSNLKFNEMNTITDLNTSTINTIKKQLKLNIDKIYPIIYLVLISMTVIK